MTRAYASGGGGKAVDRLSRLTMDSLRSNVCWMGGGVFGVSKAFESHSSLAPPQGSMFASSFKASSASAGCQTNACEDVLTRWLRG